MNLYLQNIVNKFNQNNLSTDWCGIDFKEFSKEKSLFDYQQKALLNPEVKDKLEHFFGTIVLKKEITGLANKSIIVDGQQRLTTTLLFLIALRDLEEDIEKKDYITNTYLLDPSSNFEDRIKLKQVTKDWEAYKALVNGHTPIPGVITSAYMLLKNLIQEQKQLNPNITFDHYIIAIQRMNVAVIFLDERPFKGEDPQIIFETLNSLGKPLTLSDLVRNFVLLKLNTSQQTEIYEETWYPKIENILNENTSKFLRDYLQYKTSRPLKVVSDNNTKELYQQFKEFVETKFDNDSNEFIDDIVKYVKLYKWIITEENHDDISSNIKELLRNIFHDIESEAFKPFVLGILEYHQYVVDNVRIDDDFLISTLETIRTYLIRRRILGLTQGENKNIVLLCKNIKDIAQRNVSIVDLLTNMSYKLRLPNDTEIENALKTMNFYKELRQYAKFILGKIEEYNSRVSVNFRKPEITIEHIMPQKLNDTWRNELGDNWEEIHNKYLHNIGNLILTEFNSEMGNRSFNEKKERLNSSNLSYRHDIINRNTWNEQSITEHQENMIKWFLETFSLPENYKYNNNWNIETQDVEYFSPLDDDAADIAEGNKPSELRIFDKNIEVRTWQDVFLNFLKYIKESPAYSFDFIIENQIELFRRDDAILIRHQFEERLDNNNDLLSRYKTLDGRTWDRVQNLDENVLFIHINISASTCMMRIANVMNKLYWDRDAVTIYLRD